MKTPNWQHNSGKDKRADEIVDWFKQDKPEDWRQRD